ncbi:Nodulin MtN21 /EamA-like transporter family protein [Heracleum sosnowskyi]|uniref:WAT1-related protein n=1 Tax=Heracleum sosnowskyi TaxID=360622 RepID=A0AAD8LWA7_9APIA|nr:Nodulin MtN21 /EamA-like transporter family protein [Heracleum sosnowskyi]
MTLNMKKMCNIVHGLKPTILMVIAETILGGSNVLYKLAANDGVDLRILVAYRFLFAAAFMIPVAFLVERNKRPKLTWMVIWQSFLSALLGGSVFQNLYILSLVLTSATFATATTNLVTAITFVLALCFRLEKLNWDKASGKAKVAGTLLSLAGAMVLTLYKGPAIVKWNTHLDIVNHDNHHDGHVVGTHTNLILGACAALGSITCYALWINLQAKIAEYYPCPYSSSTLMITMTSIQCTLYALCMQRDWNQWKLGWNIGLLTVSYAGVLATGLMYTLVAWCVRMRGPLFVSAFNPLMVVIVALAGPLILNENLFVGSVLGGITIICGLYVLLWGKAMEMNTKTRLPETSSGDMSKPVNIVLAPLAGPLENDKSVVSSKNTPDMITAYRASAAEANADEEPDEIRSVEN